MIDEVRWFGPVDRGEIEVLLDLHGMTPDFFRQIVERVGGHDASAPHADELAGMDHFPGDDGMTAGYVTFSDFAFIGKVSRRVLAHETSASARRAGRFAVCI